jgi:hypothetical protein
MEESGKRKARTHVIPRRILLLAKIRDAVDWNVAEEASLASTAQNQPTLAIGETLISGPDPRLSPDTRR